MKYIYVLIHTFADIGGWGQMGEGGQRVQTSSYIISNLRTNVQYGDYN